MATKHCPKCGSVMARFENPERYICPTPQKHNQSHDQRRVGNKKGRPKKK